MITADTSPIFPACPTFGFSSEPEYLNVATEREGGYERVTNRWDRPLHKYNGVPMGDQPEANIQELLWFWHAMRGTYRTFRFKDWLDYKNCATHETPAYANAQPIVSESAQYRLYKQYKYGGSGGIDLITQDRRITRPKGSTIKIYNELGAEQVSSKWTLDEATGVITAGGTFTGTPSWWTGEFYVPCRFDGTFPAEISNHKIQSVVVSLREKRE
jgi:uncharacterized protein (TIGR02217 family)